MVLLSAQGMDVAMIAQVRVHHPGPGARCDPQLNADGFDSLRPKYAGGRPPKFDAEQHAQITQIPLARLGDHGLPFSTWSLSKLADYLVAQGVVEDILTRRRGCCCVSRASPFQAVKTFKASTDPDCEAKKNRVLALHATAEASRPPPRATPMW